MNAIEPSIIAASANDRISVEHLDNGSARIANESGTVTIPAAAIGSLCQVLRELDAIPRLHAAEFTDIPVTHDVVLVVCSDGTVIVLVGTEYPYATIQLETGDLARVTRAVG